MAQRVSVVLVDDIDGSEATQTIPFSFEGTQYEIDLSEDNIDRFREVLAPYIGHARRAGTGRRRGGSPGRSSGSGRSGGSGSPSAADIRAWARENGHDVPDRGRVSAEVREAYAAAH